MTGNHERALYPRSGTIKLDTSPRPYALLEGTPKLLPITTGQALLQWFRNNLCAKMLVDPRGQRVSFLETDLIHLVKLVDRNGNEPRNRAMAIEQLSSGRLQLKPGRFDIRRAGELAWARSIIEFPDLIVPNWQVLGSANPGDAYIRNFAARGSRPVFRVLICGHQGLRRRPVTIFPRERFAPGELHPPLWP